MASDWYRVPRAPYKSKFWSVELIPIPLELSAGGQYHNGKLYKTKQVVIRGHTRTIAQQALNLIHDVLNVIAGSTVFASAFSDDEPRLYSPESSLTDKIEIDKYPIGFSWNPQICLACMIAARASLKMASVYALSRLSLSIHLFSTSTTLLSPYRGQNVPKSDFPHDRVAMALAIVAAYSCIEELGVEIRASTLTQAVSPVVCGIRRSRVIWNRDYEMKGST